MVFRLGASLFSRRQHIEREVFFRIPDRDSVKLRVSTNTKAAEIKQKLATVTGVAVENQRCASRC